MKRTRKSKMPSWAKAVVLGSKPTIYSYNTKFGIQGALDRCLFFCPMYDATDVCDTSALGSGAGYHDYTQPTTEINWPVMLGESPHMLFSWQINNAINDLGEQKRKYIWGPRSFKWEITNQETFPLELKIYWGKCRRSIDWDAANAFNQDRTMDYARCYDLNDFIARCLVRDNILAVPIAANRKLQNNLPIAFTPYQSHTFCQWFKIVKTTKIKLDAGQCAILKQGKSKWRNIGDLDFMDVAYSALKGQLIPFIHVVGCPVFDSADYRKVGAGKPRLNIIYQARFPWYTMNDNIQSYVKVDLPAPAGGVTPANARYVSKPVASAVQAV